jgi:hypothetical protein
VGEARLRRGLLHLPCRRDFSRRVLRHNVGTTHSRVEREQATQGFFISQTNYTTDKKTNTGSDNKTNTRLNVAWMRMYKNLTAQPGTSAWNGTFSDPLSHFTLASETCEKTPSCFLECFPYVCPEPVLVK